MRFPHHGDGLPARFASIPSPGPFDKLHSSVQVNVPLPVHMSAQEVREVVDQKVDSLRVDMNNRFNRERELTDLHIAEIKQDDSKVMEVEIELKMTEDEKEEYKKEIRRLQERIGQLEGKE
jgi:septal ring factor EnvC (AmiA/AmiB activator)